LTYVNRRFQANIKYNTNYILFISIEVQLKILAVIRVVIFFQDFWVFEVPDWLYHFLLEKSLDIDQKRILIVCDLNLVVQEIPIDAKKH